MTTNGYIPGTRTSQTQARFLKAENSNLNALYEIIENFMTAPGDLPNLMTGSILDDESKVLAISSLVERGLKRLSKAQLTALATGKTAPLDSEYPIQEAASILLTKKSENGFGGLNIVRAVVGSMGNVTGKEESEDKPASVVIENRG